MDVSAGAAMGEDEDNITPASILSGEEGVDEEVVALSCRLFPFPKFQKNIYQKTSPRFTLVLVLNIMLPSCRLHGFREIERGTEGRGVLWCMIDQIILSIRFRDCVGIVLAGKKIRRPESFEAWPAY